MFKLTIEDDEGKTTVIPVIRDEMTIGRQEGNTIRLTERNVSRRHARLVRQNGTIYVEDLASFTGVRVNGTKIAAVTPVQEGDEVQIGDYKLLLRAERVPVNVDGDRPTMPSMPASLGPMATVGGSVAIPTRATAAAMAAQAAAAAAPAPVRSSSPVPVAGGTPDPIEAQPTIPVRTLEAGYASPQPDVAPPARLVVLTTEIAGMEFSLNRPSVVVGRTDENEIVVNHRSISRHHAKIVRDGDRYTIVDLQSANGVRVNGEDYERIELHPGDMIELGHVKLRFVGPFEHYVFDPNVRHDAARFPTRVVLGVAVAAMAAVIGVAVQRGLRAKPAPTAVAAVAAPTQAAAAVPAAPPSAAVPAAAAEPPAPAAPDAPATPQDILAEANRLASGEDWEAARAALDRLGTQVGDPALRREAIGLRRRIDTERQGALSFAKFDEAQTAKNYAEAVARFQDIPGDSLYRKRARARFEEARALLVAEHLTTAERARTAGRCAEVKQEAEEVTLLDPHNQLIKELVRLCRPRAEPVAAPTRAARTKPVPTLAQTSHPERVDRVERVDRAERVEPTPAKHTEAAPSEGDADADALMKQARDAWLRQQCGSAIDLSRKALRARPGLTDAYQIIAVCSCSLKDAEGATRAYGKLDDKSRGLVHTLCQKNGIVVGAE